MKDVLNLGLLFQLFRYVLVSLGYWNIFKKCGVKPYYSWIPFAREYHIGLCANREKEARTFTIVYVLSEVVGLINNFNPGNGSKIFLIIAVVLLSLQITQVVYMFRIYLGLIEVFGQRKRWLFGFIFFEWITTFIWGLSPKFVPGRQVESLSSLDGVKVSGTEAPVIESGLTVNITERKVVDFFRKKVLLKDIHMTIPKGHMVLLLGGSGAGKTTYLNAVTGYEKADAVVKLDGQDIYTDYAKMKYDVGFVPQQDLMRGNDTVALTLTDAASLRLPSSVSFLKKKKRVNEVLEEFGLATVRNSLVEKLSGGQRKRLSIAMEYISDPTLFILDEPDSGLDGVVARGLFEKLRAIADQGKIVIVITHTPDRVIDLFDDVIVLAKDKSRTGRLAWYGPVDEAREFFEKDSMEGILLAINQKDEGGEGKADEFVEKYTDKCQKEAG
ncbi:MAG: ABC transporter ATP-binding protein [Lachnospiraceae bacterium]|nr:ABC transporter ATP-binding protein [Lachnospiraceae bacterium]MBO4900100.1 ABC transporter ATP-binding protein [Lachnospiraceae bacterium]